MSSLPLHLICVSILLIFWCWFLYVALLCIFAFLVPICDVRYNFSIKPMFGSSLPLFVCRWAHVLFLLFVFVCVKWIYEAGTAYPSRASGFTPGFLVGSVLLIFLFFCVVFHFFFYFMFFLSCVPNVASAFGLSNLDCPLQFPLTFISIVLAPYWCVPHGELYSLWLDPIVAQTHDFFYHTSYWITETVGMMEDWAE
jgi:hypothetical protein